MLSARWPTPNADNAHGGRNYRRDGSKYNPCGSYGQTLIDAVSATKPTPQARDHKGKSGPNHKFADTLSDTVALWSTPAAQDGKNATLPPSLARRDTLVGDVMRLWHSPSAGDGEGGHTSVPGTSPIGKRPDGSKTSTTLANDMRATEERGVLNADWVEALMNFPVGWTDLDRYHTSWPGWPSLPHEPQHAYEPPRTLPKGKAKQRNARLKALGNAVVPFQAAPIFAAISQMEEEMRDDPGDTNPASPDSPEVQWMLQQAKARHDERMEHAAQERAVYGHSQEVIERKEQERQTLIDLLRRLTTTDPFVYPQEVDALQEEARAFLKTLS